MDNPRWTQRPDGANWGDFSPDDQLGRLNLITAEKVRQGVAEVQEGLTFSLSLPLDYPGGNGLNPRRHPPVLRPTMRDGLPMFNAADVGTTDVVCDDLVIMHLQYSTQWDALCHVGSQFDADGDGVAERVYYNGFRADEHIVGPDDAADGGITDGMRRESTSGAGKLGIEGMAAHGVQGRAVMIDLRAHFGDARRLVDYDDMMRVIEADGVVVETGDMVCLHTGFAQRVLEMKRQPDPDLLHGMCCALNGRDTRLLQWITDSGLAVLIADNYAVEGLPAEEGVLPCARMPLHEHCLFKNGIHLGELWHLTPLAEWLRARGRSRFLLTAPPLRLPGAVGSPANPIATV
ncbi:cyclase family protein [Acuticoccus sp. I52.16.1]|uniref:cyclase family protein n=1 Tax=Acuticoccus sp. I52.16.1 TaxID=2928472 RepID=UPI001FD29314|nr:cyclase family protein [Acuticoccus sp. I52.16.1]UOM36289.1 cyclase family protein [Acuticoccus sp. I52.16.1]